MTTLILETAGSVAGSAFGGPIGSSVGRVVGAVAGGLIDSLFGGSPPTRFVEGPRLTDISGLSSTEGEAIPRVYGRTRIGGTLIWATRPLEVANTTVTRSPSGLKGGGGQKTVTTTYSYYANLAIGLCVGRIAYVRRVWADGKEIDLTKLTVRVHTGSPSQSPDPLIVAKEGADSAPAYRGLAYIVFERLPLEDFGNRVPQFVFEVIRPVDGLAEKIRAVCLIPGSTEFGLDALSVIEDAGFGKTKPSNHFQLQALSDVVASLDALQALCPRLEKISVVVSWFGDDLRVGQCRVRPCVDNTTKVTIGTDWAVAGIQRLFARPVSQILGGGPAYGGTPSDDGLVRLVAELQRRGLSVVLYPFLMMDIPAGNALPDPRRPGQSQAPYPWRGRMTCDPAPGLSGSPDGTTAAATQVSAFFDGLFGYRAFVLHYATLFASANLHGFVIGSEFVGLTRVRGSAGSYPAVDRFRDLAHDVRAVLGSSVKLVYAADWTEYGADARDGGGTLRFPLDALFADAAIDAVGIDYYPPISDWRDGNAHADAAEATDVYDRAYLKRRLASGEAFDWYYASDAARAAQTRTPITDGAYGKPWVYCAKDLVSWWSNPHVERDGGVETRTTPWLPGSKPIWLTEIGIPAVDRGTNAPNVFPDPKSSENAAPPFSRGTRDDLIQARGLEAILSRFDPALAGFVSAHNPAWATSGLRMVDPASIFVWCWDARPFPAFPDFDTVWTDAPNWQFGHWITGRADGQELDRLVAAVLADLGIDAPCEIDAAGFLDGFVIDRPLSARGVLEPLANLFGLDVCVSAGRLRIRGPGVATPLALANGDLVEESEDAAPLRRVRAEESELPRSVEVGFSDGESAEYRRATAAAIRPAGGRRRQARIEAAIVTRRACAQVLAEAALDASLAARETATFALSPRRIELEPGDLVTLPQIGAPALRIARIADSPLARRIETQAVPDGRGDQAGTVEVEPRPRRPPPALPGPPFVASLDLPLTRNEPTTLQYLAVAADPWPGAAAVWRSAAPGAPLALHRTVAHPACLGKTLGILPKGPVWRFDRSASVEVTLRHAEGLASVEEAAALAGANLFALRGPDGAIEIFSAAGITLTGPDSFRLTTLLRGLAGSEAAACRACPAGSLIVRLDDGAVVPLIDRLDESGRTFTYRVGPADRDPADPAFVGFEASAGLVALTPLSPVQLRARRESGGVRFSWIRRGRRDSDAWEPAEIPLDEPESYVLDILGVDGSMVRSLGTLTSSALYAQADETTDFGAAQTMIAAAVAQVGTVAGRGPALRSQVPVRAA